MDKMVEKLLGLVIVVYFIAALVPSAVNTIFATTITDPTAQLLWGILGFVIVAGIVLTVWKHLMHTGK